MAAVTFLKANQRDIGAFQVRRVLPAAKRQSVGPFLFFDHFGPMDVAPGAGHDVRPHPHIGLATVSYCSRVRSSTATVSARCSASSLAR